MSAPNTTPGPWVAIAPQKVSVDYITAGKAYAITEELGRGFSIICDDEDEIYCLWEGCAHLDGGSWTRGDQ